MKVYFNKWSFLETRKNQWNQMWCKQCCRTCTCKEWEHPTGLRQT